MPAEIVSLSQYRKAKKKAEKENQAAANRERFGRKKGQRSRDADDEARRDKDLDAKRLEDDSADDSSQ